jgi:hypothetical protein
MIDNNPRNVSGRGTDERVTVVRSRSTMPADVHRHDRSEQESHEHHQFAHLADWRVHWGPVFAGLLTAITSMVLLSLLGAAIGLTAFNAGTAAAQGGPPPDAARNAGIWEGLAAIVSFAIGGYVASRTAGLLDRNWGAFHGAMVFFLAVPVMLYLAGTGLGAIMGGVGSYLGNMNPADVVNAARGSVPNVSPTDVARAAERARDTAWVALIGALLGLAAAAIGGYMGVHHFHMGRERHDHMHERHA